MNGMNACLLEFFGHAEIKVRRIDADKHIRLEAEQIVHQPFADFQNLRQAFDDLNKTAHRQLFLIVQTLKTLRLHALAADAGKPRIRATRLNGTD